jgi:transposase InsO family protein
MIKEHETSYPHHPSAERLLQLDLCSAEYRRLRTSVRDRAVRESQIGQDEVDAIVNFYLEHPEVGARRAHHTLVDQEKALISTGFINEAKQELAELADKEYRKRDEAEKLIEAELRARRAEQPPYKNVAAQHPNHIWAIDFVALDFLGFKLVVCEVYDVFTQAYHAIQAGTGCDHQLAQATIQNAVANAGDKAGRILRRDNGKAFEVESFQAMLDGKMVDAPIPPGNPWLNGSLESNNTSLKATIRTKAMQAMPDQGGRYRHAHGVVSKAVALLQQASDRARITLNDELSRSKFAMPPAQVLNGEQATTQERHSLFRSRKKQERKQRMEALRDNPDRSDSGKRFIDKIRSSFHRFKATLKTDQLYVLNEILHSRFQAIGI